MWPGPAVSELTKPLHRGLGGEGKDGLGEPQKVELRVFGDVSLVGPTRPLL